MQKLTEFLETLKEHNNQDFEKVYSILRTLIYDEDNILHFQLEQFKIDALLDTIDEQVDFEIIEGIDVLINENKQKLFPLAEYGWDGGYSIKTKMYNLKSLVNSDIASGPFASIVQLENAQFAGLALHTGQDFAVIQLFQ